MIATGADSNASAGAFTAWNKDKQHAAAMQRIRAQMAGVCAKLPAADPAHAACDGALPSRAGA